jgi:hypothetical protein
MSDPNQVRTVVVTTDGVICIIGDGNKNDSGALVADMMLTEYAALKLVESLADALARMAQERG